MGNAVGLKILVVSATPTHPAHAGNRSKLFSLLKALQTSGHEIHFLYVNKEQNFDKKAMTDCWDAFYMTSYSKPVIKRESPGLVKKIKQLLSKITNNKVVTPFKIDDWYDPEISEYINKHLPKQDFGAVLVLYVFFSKVFEEFGPKVIKILEAQDIFTDRHKLYIKRNMEPTFFYTTRKQEARGLNRADVILAIQDREKVFYEKICKKNVITIGHLVETKYTPKEIFPGKEIRLLFVASENPINVEGLDYFLSEIFTSLLKRYPNMELHLVGGICTRFKNRKNLQGCCLVGKVGDLYARYAMADIVINPVREGTGLNIKSIEALGYGKPLITTIIGAKGLEDGINSAYLIADDLAAFTNSIDKLINDSKYYKKISSNAYNYAVEYNKKCLKELQCVFEK